MAGGQELTVNTAPDQRIRVAFVAAAFDAEAAKAVEQSIEIIRHRIDQMGTKEPDITRQGKDRIVIQAAGESDPERLKSVIGQTAKLTFQMVDETASSADIAAGRVPPGDEVLASTDGSAASYVVKRRSVVTDRQMLTENTRMRRLVERGHLRCARRADRGERPDPASSIDTGDDARRPGM